MKTIRVGTRPSQLALSQTAMFIEALSRLLPETTLETITIKTTGDSKQNSDNISARDKRDWIEELEQAILEEKIDIAVHSGKDVPYQISEGTTLMSVLDRADPRDVFIGKLTQKDCYDNEARIKFKELPQGARIGTASLRRRAQLLILRPDLKVIELRGNVPTRINKLDSKLDYDGIILAAAGLIRLGTSIQNLEPISSDSMLPASAQGILTVQYNKNRQDLAEILNKISFQQTENALKAERAVVRCLNADCSSAVAVYAQMLNQELKVQARVFSSSKQEFIEANAIGPSSEAEKLGILVGDELLSKGAKKLLYSS